MNTSLCCALPGPARASRQCSGISHLDYPAVRAPGRVKLLETVCAVLGSRELAAPPHRATSSQLCGTPPRTLARKPAERALRFLSPVLGDLQTVCIFVPSQLAAYLNQRIKQSRTSNGKYGCVGSWGGVGIPEAWADKHCFKVPPSSAGTIMNVHLSHRPHCWLKLLFASDSSRFHWNIKTSKPGLVLNI